MDVYLLYFTFTASKKLHNPIDNNVHNNAFLEIPTGSKCKGACGTEGTILKSQFEKCYENMDTKENRCITESLRSSYEPCAMEACPPKASYGPWSEWTKCSLKCLKNVSERSEKTKTRTCTNSNCNGNGLIEKKDCEVGICQPKCPR